MKIINRALFVAYFLLFCMHASGNEKFNFSEFMGQLQKEQWLKTRIILKILFSINGSFRETPQGQYQLRYLEDELNQHHYNFRVLQEWAYEKHKEQMMQQEEDFRNRFLTLRKQNNRRNLCKKIYSKSRSGKVCDKEWQQLQKIVLKK